jgi:hypothetical protein
MNLDKIEVKPSVFYWKGGQRRGEGEGVRLEKGSDFYFHTFL